MSIWKDEDDDKNKKLIDEFSRKKQRGYERAYYAKHRKQVIRRNKKRDRYKDRSEYSKKWYAEHKEEKLKKRKEWYEENKEAYCAKERERYQKNKEAINKRRRELRALKKAREANG